ncbi:MAG TPA: hypothetical protein VGJ20_20240 [Xanthobacteraceae bacterium]|jgi:hypothetical protein
MRRFHRENDRDKITMLIGYCAIGMGIGHVIGWAAAKVVTRMIEDQEEEPCG